MKLFEGFWIEGWMPVQLVGLLLLIFLVFVITNTLLKRIGMGVPPFWQAVLVWSSFYGIFRYVVFPPLPSSLFYTYIGLITLAVFMYIGSTDELWEGFKRPILATLAAENPGRKRLRDTIFIVAPILTMAGTYSLVVPKFEEPVALRTVRPVLPVSVMVHGHTYRLDTPNPFRVNDRGDYSPNTQSAYTNGAPWGQNPPQYLKYVREGGVRSIFRTVIFATVQTQAVLECSPLRSDLSPQILSRFSKSKGMPTDICSLA